jgi:hypothetical protein
MACDQFPDIFEHFPAGASTDERNAIEAANKQRSVLYRAVRYLLLNRFNYSGTLPEKTSDLESLGQDPAFPFFISIFGLLLSDNFVDPTMGKTVFGSDDIRTVDDHNHRINIARKFVDEMVSLVSEFQASEPLYVNVYNILRDLGTSTTTNGATKTNGGTTTPTPTPPAPMPPQPSSARVAANGLVTADAGGTMGTGGSSPPPSTPPAPGGTNPADPPTGMPGATVFARQVAEVSRNLVQEGASATDPQLKVRVTALLSVVIGDSIDGRASAIDVDLPDLEEETQATILKDNVNALAAVYFAAMLEDYKVFDVANTVADQFMQGILPLSRGPGGNSIYDYIRATPNRFTAVERRTIYAQSLGLAQGSVDVQLPNREFQDLWIRFVSTASLANRQASLANSRLVTTGALVTPEQVFKAAKDLAVNLSLHGYGIGHFAAIELQKLIKTVMAMLSFPDVIAAYGVRDIWQLVERVSQLYLGGSVNGVRQRTMAHHGAKIIEFLAQQAAQLSGAFTTLDLSPINTNVEQWLAVTGTDDNTVDKYSAPVAVTQQPTIPQTFGTGQSMDLVRNALQQVGGIAPGMIPNLNIPTNGVALPKA